MHTSNEDRVGGYATPETHKTGRDSTSHWLENLIKVLAAIFLVACLVMALASLPHQMGYGMRGQYAFMLYLPSLMFAVGGLVQWAFMMAIAYILQYLRNIERNTAQAEPI
ncbi:hypothetical protein [Thalassospira sp. TSL5-1]|uniref:hypothetical protein n=1 Tax=Thalassospira sp. TSL5-1 TaxID=1544451 RepID=UPI00093DB86C|nr:hypothetical protein [Thalassospira sp. TSL5-1]OKH89694.1 hypothetical protein LF95_07165 [Thalassospira sp. TSL5-1]